MALDGRALGRKRDIPDPLPRLYKRKKRMTKNPVAEFGGRCHYCEQKFAKLTKDHIVPTSRGGVNRHWNWVQACDGCNQTKSSEWPTCTCSKCRAAIRRHMKRGVKVPQSWI